MEVFFGSTPTQYFDQKKDHGSKKSQSPPRTRGPNDSFSNPDELDARVRRQQREIPEELSVSECTLFHRLLNEHWGTGVRLEQERVPLTRVKEFLTRAGLVLI